MHGMRAACSGCSFTYKCKHEYEYKFEYEYKYEYEYEYTYTYKYEPQFGCTGCGRRVVAVALMIFIRIPRGERVRKSERVRKTETFS